MNKKRTSRLFWAAKALLVGVLLYVTVAVVVTPLYLGRALKPSPATGGARVADGLPVETRSRPPADLAAIVENNLFAGPVPAPTETGAPSPVEVVRSPEQGLDLRLVGAIAGGASTSRAILQNTTTGVTLPYKVGDIVASATIESIEPDRVILRHNGQRKALPLQSGAITPEKGRSGSAPTQGRATPQGAPPVAQPAIGSPPSGGMSYIENALHKATIEPYVHKGQTTGLKITGLESTSLTGLFGLKNGDVVQTINGQTLTSKQKAFQVLQKARTQSKLQVQLLRDGKTKELSFDLQ